VRILASTTDRLSKLSGFVSIMNPTLVRHRGLIVACSFVLEQEY